MTIPTFQHFQNLETHHCVTGSLRHLYVFNNVNLSEDMLLGLGEGVSFIYWHPKGELPVLAGRGAPKPSIEEVIGKRTGVEIVAHTTTSARKAEKTLVELLETGQAVPLQVDMGFLPYLDFGYEEYHFGGHLVIACGYDRETNTVLIADRDANLHPMSMTELAKARGSTFKPMPPKNRWLTADFTYSRLPTTDEVYQAIHNQAELMLNPPMSSLGVKGIRKAAQAVPKWVESIGETTLPSALFNAHIFINAEGGTGGGTFRYMFSRFLHEAGTLVENPDLAQCSDSFHAIGDKWDNLGRWFQKLSQASTPVKDLSEAEVMLNAIADMEEDGWTNLQMIIKAHKKIAIS